MSVIDFRVRPNTAEFMAYYASDKWANHWRLFGHKPPTAEPLEAHLTRLRELGIERIVCTGRQHPANEKNGVPVSNDSIARIAQEHSDAVIGFAGIDPTQGMAAVREVQRCADIGLVGLSVDVRQPMRRPDDRQYYMVYAKAAELQLPVVITLGPFAGRFGSLDAVDQAAEDFPEVRFVLSHGIWPSVDQAIALAWRRQNVFLETSVYPSFPGTDILWEAANTIISDKVIYASGFPFDPLETVSVVQGKPLSPANLRRVMYENAAGLLGIGR